MSSVSELLPGMMVELDERTADLGGGWYHDLEVYAPQPLQWVYNRLHEQPLPVLIDVGASAGCFTLLAKFLPTLKVLAFEPVPLSADTLEANIALNDIASRVTVYRAAVSNADGPVKFHVVDPPQSSALSMLGGHPTDHKSYHDIDVPIVTLNGFCAEHEVWPSLIKIDTEGHELAVLVGASSVLDTAHPDLLVEWSELNASQYNYHPREILEYLSAHHYQFDVRDNDVYATYRGTNGSEERAG